jgi:aminoglycoside phosphotransferase (APT) family kinase protein
MSRQATRPAQTEPPMVVGDYHLENVIGQGRNSSRRDIWKSASRSP